ncbi:hypothetical protein NPIL_224791 [Nephila pilipes]|uniref:Uncharacterized protein n=1 Tax=Nephila pilipes TaxID=299642 RepID=A0A8X6NCX7_NEPPI|nr:hypothetical protein NPIL_224791 [Nephila pilipes]
MCCNTPTLDCRFSTVSANNNAVTREQFEGGNRSDEHMDVKQHARSLDISSQGYELSRSVRPHEIAYRRNYIIRGRSVLNCRVLSIFVPLNARPLV